MATVNEDTSQLSHYQKYIKPRLQNDEEHRAKHNAKTVRILKNKYDTDEAFHEQHNNRTRLYNKNRYATDSAFRERKKEQARAKYLLKKLAHQQPTS
jgi:hypothetical protein